jgi:tripartite-type tricarboxylate transporter receptor subunit TctC
MICMSRMHRMYRKGRLLAALPWLALLWLCGGAPLQAQNYPVKPVRLVVPFAPAGVADIVARVVAERLSQQLTQNVVVFNREGGGSTIGIELAAKATPDGYTLLLASAALTMHESVIRKLNYDTRRDLAPISLVFEQPAVLVAHPSVPANSVQELIAYARANPGKLRYGSSGVGGVINLVTELFKYQARIDITHVPYKGVAPAMVDLVGGQIDLVMSGTTNALPLVKSGKLKALGVTSRKRVAALPEVPPIAEQGLPAYESSTWYGVLAPAGVADPVLARLNAMLVQIVAMADVRERFAAQGGEARATTRAEFVALIAHDLARWRQVVHAAGLKAE